MLCVTEFSCVYIYSHDGVAHYVCLCAFRTLKRTVNIPQCNVGKLFVLYFEQRGSVYIAIKSSSSFSFPHYTLDVSVTKLCL